MTTEPNRGGHALIALSFATALLASRPAVSQNAFWIAPGSGDWSVPTNWTDGDIPDNGGGAIIQDELTGQSSTITVTLDSSRDVAALHYRTGYSFNVASAPGQTLNTLSNTLTLNAEFTIVSSAARFFTTANEVSATIAGPNLVNKVGVGSVSLSGANNTFKVALAINEGTLWVNTALDSTFGDPANLLILNGGAVLGTAHTGGAVLTLAPTKSPFVIVGQCIPFDAVERRRFGTKRRCVVGPSRGLGS